LVVKGGRGARWGGGGKSSRTFLPKASGTYSPGSRAILEVDFNEFLKKAGSLHIEDWQSKQRKRALIQNFSRRGATGCNEELFGGASQERGHISRRVRWVTLLQKMFYGEAENCEEVIMTKRSGRGREKERRGHRKGSASRGKRFKKKKEAIH